MNYANTTTAVQVGDRVLIKRFFRKPMRGIVAYIPGQGKAHAEMNYAGRDDFGISVDDGREIWAYPYFPSGTAPSGILFVSRGSPGDEQLLPDERLY